MIKIAVFLAAFLTDRKAVQVEDRDRGATAVEYGLMIALIAAVIIGAVVALGGSVSKIFQDTSNTISKPPVATAGP